MSRRHKMSRVEFRELCKPVPQKGYALDTPYSIATFLAIAAAIELSYKEANNCIQLIEHTTGRKIKQIFFRKAYIRQHPMFSNLTDPGTWLHPLDSYYRRHSNKYNIDGSVLITVVDEFSILSTERCFLNNAEEYALRLRDGIRWSFIDNGDKRIRGFSSPGRRDGGDSAAYMVYMDYKFEEQWPLNTVPVSSFPAINTTPSFLTSFLPPLSSLLTSISEVNLSGPFRSQSKWSILNRAYSKLCAT